jgi:hypothetical protein
LRAFLFRTFFLESRLWSERMLLPIRSLQLRAFLFVPSSLNLASGAKECCSLFVRSNCELSFRTFFLESRLWSERMLLPVRSLQLRAFLFSFLLFLFLSRYGANEMCSLFIRSHCELSVLISFTYLSVVHYIY